MRRRTKRKRRKRRKKKRKEKDEKDELAKPVEVEVRKKVKLPAPLK